MEQRLWEENVKSSFLGIQVDFELVDNLLAIRNYHFAELTKKFLDLSSGVKPTQVQVFRELLALDYGVWLDNLQAKTLEDTLKEGGLHPDAAEMLTIRQSLSKVATKKLDKFGVCACADRKLRGMLVYYGAGTGRFAGRLVQLHNLARGSFKVKDHMIDLILETGGDPAAFEMMFDNVVDAISTFIRPCITASPGKVMYDADYSAIEARGTAWLAGQQDMLNDFIAGRDVYKVMATRIFGVKYSDIDEETHEGWFMRWVGKNAILGLGYQMGALKFEATCEKYGQPIDSDLAQRTVDIYRNTNHRIRQLWYSADDCFKNCIRHPNQVYTLGPVSMAFNGRYVFVRLPSGRTITYITPRITTVEKDWGPTQVIQYKGIDSKTRQWVWIELYGGKIVENIVQAIARDLMAHGIFNVIDAGFSFLLSVHDQILCEHPEEGRLDEYLDLMTEVPAWAKGFPLAAEGKECRRFSK